MWLRAVFGVDGEELALRGSGYQHVSQYKKTKRFDLVGCTGLERFST